MGSSGEARSYSKENEKRPRLSLLTVGLAALFSTLLIFSGAMTSFLAHEGVSDFISLYARSALVSVLVVAASVAGFSLAGKSIPLKAISGVGGVVHLVASAFFCYLVLAGDQGASLTCFGGAASGVGCGLLCLVWGKLFSRFPLSGALLNVAAASCVAAIVYACIMLAPTLAGVGVFMVCAAVCAVTPSLFDHRALLEHESTKGRGSEKASSLPSFFGVVAEPALGLLVFAFIMGITCYTYTEWYSDYLLASFVASAILVVLAFLRLKKPIVQPLYRNIIPLLAIIMLAVSSMSTALSGESATEMFCMFLLYSFAVTLTVATLCAIAHASEFSSDFIYSIALVLFAAASLVGLSCSEILSEETISVVVTAVTTLYAAVMLVARSIRQSGDALIDEDGLEEDGSQTLGERCADLARAYSLTDREHEILELLARGYASAELSETLFISPNTVRTHIHNMYRKLGVASREDLSQLVRDR